MGLVAWYKCDDSSASTVVVDSSGNGYDGTSVRNTDLMAAAGKVRGALDFNGTTDKVDVANPGSVLDGTYLTVMAWVYRNGTSGTTYPRIVDRVYNGQFALYITESGSHIGVALKASSGTVDYPTLSSTDAVPVNTWVHVALVVRSTGISVYANGVDVGTGSVVGTLAASASAIRIGERVDAGTARTFKGYIDDVRIYNEALTAAQIQAIYANNTWSSAASTDYSVADNWERGHIPTTGETAYFDGTSTVNCVATANITADAMTATAAYTGTIDLADSSYSHAVAGDVILDCTGFDLGNCTLTIGGTFDGKDVTTWTYGSAHLILTGGGEIRGRGGYAFIYSLTITSGASYAVTYSATVSGGNLTFDGGVVNIEATCFLATVTYSRIVFNSGTLSATGDGYLYLYMPTAGRGLTTFTSGLISAPVAVKGAYLGAVLAPGIYGGLVKWQNSGTSSGVWIPSTGTYYFNGGLACLNDNAASSITIDNSVNNPNFNIQGGVTFTQSVGTLTYTKGSGTITLSGGNANINFLGKSVESVVVNSTGTKTLNGNLSTVDLTLTAGTLDASATNYSTTLSGSFSQSTAAKFLGRSSTITVNGNGTFTANGTMDSTQFNNATLVLNGTNTLTYGNLSATYANGFGNLIVGQSGNTTSLAANLQFAINTTLSLGTGTLSGLSGTAIFLNGSSPLSFDAASTLSIGTLIFRAATQTIPTLTNGYGCDVTVYNPAVVTQAGNVTLAAGKILNLGFLATYVTTWKTDGYDLDAPGGVKISYGSDTGLKKLDATGAGGRSSTITVGGNWLNYGTGTAPSQFIADNSAVILNPSAAGKTITTGKSKFNAIRFAATGAGAWILQDELRANLVEYASGTIVNPGLIRPWPYPADLCRPLLCNQNRNAT